MRISRATMLMGLLLSMTMTSLAFAGYEKVAGGIRFVYEGDYAGSVSVAGDFNGWNGTATPMTKSGDVWSVVVSLGPGTHEYKFVVDGQWVADPDNPTRVGDFGNSAIQIGPD
ncbi:MAG: hypothetical protein HKN21_13915, partial [Candidatus Eisenbacteria bacterium]|nr:hypothetical protein [Candidatus Eisenbacteria bacterium]